MIKENEIDPNHLEEGQVLQYEEKYYAAAVVEVLDVGYREREDTDPYQSVEVEVLEPIFGNVEEGETLTLGRTTADGLQHYIDWKFKKPGSMTDYVNTETLDEHRDKMEEIKEKYDRSE